jgi:uncharacterized protein (TIGR03435 family)
MRRDDQRLTEILDSAFPAASDEQVESGCERVWQQLSDVTSDSDENSQAFTATTHPLSTWRVSRIVPAVAFAALVLLAFALIRGLIWHHEDYATVLEGSVDRLDGGKTLRTNDPAGAVLALSDSSRVEMRSQSQVQIDHAGDGLRIYLSDGSIIVTAAKQGTGHLYVETKDAVVSVVGTVFLVSTEKIGSRVGVIEGVVNVQQGAISQTLLQGQQLSTNPAMEPLALDGQVGWSRSVVIHNGLLQEAISRAQLAPAAPAKGPQNAAPRQQDKQGNPETFEVVSVRTGSAVAGGSGRGGVLPSGFGCGGTFLQVDPVRFAISANVFTLVAIAYGKDCPTVAKRDLLTGGPSWVTSDQFTIQATIPANGPTYTANQLIQGKAPELQTMLRMLLADRFRLTIRHDSKEQPVYALTVAKNGPKLTPFREGGCDASSEAVIPEPGKRPPCLRIFSLNQKSHFTVTANGITLDGFAELLTGAFDRPVVNKTGISGTFDLRLESAPDFTMYCAEPPCTKLQQLTGGKSDSAPLVFDAIQQQIGLRLESTKAPVERLVIDHVERPTEN